MSSAVKELITKHGYQALKEKQENLKREVPEITQAISDAREKGDLKENADYHAAREKKSLYESKINHIGSIMSSCVIFDPTSVKDKSIIGFGATVTLENEDDGTIVKYTLVNEHESDISNGLLSFKTPIAKALQDKSANDDVEVTTPKGVKYFTILSVEY